MFLTLNGQRHSFCPFVKKSTCINLYDDEHDILVHADQFSTPPRPIEKPFRYCVADFFKGKLIVYSGVDLGCEIGEF